jgi:hypothetical protein
MGGISLDDFTQSVAYREIFGRGEAQGEARAEAKVTLRLLSRRCGPPIWRCQSGPGRGAAQPITAAMIAA